MKNRTIIGVICVVAALLLSFAVAPLVNRFSDSRFEIVCVKRDITKGHQITDEDIQKLADTFEAFQNGTLEDVKGFCAVADLQTIEKQDYILTPGRYVGIEEQEEDSEPFDEKMARLTSELSDMFAKSHELEAEIRKKLGAIGYEI